MHSKHLVAALATTNVALIGLIIYPKLSRRIRQWWFRRRGIQSRASSRQNGNLWRPATGQPSLEGYLGKDYVPPLPKPVASALERSCLCFLATAGAANEPHLSLMRFTYTAGLEDECSEVLIISTRRNTKKYELIASNQSVALLVHDFDAEHSNDASNYRSLQEGRTKYSITLNGIVKEQSGDLAERYRAIHLAANEAYSQFIVGDDIAIITVNLHCARVCDVNDRVSHFAKGVESSQQWTEVTNNPGS